MIPGVRVSSASAHAPMFDHVFSVLSVSVSPSLSPYHAHYLAVRSPLSGVLLCTTRT